MGNPKDWTITLTPHRSLTRQGYAAIMALIAAINMVVGIFFFALGAWPIVGFLGLDVLLIWLAFRWNFRDSHCAEELRAEGDALTLRRFGATAPAAETVFNRRWVKVQLEWDEPRELTGRLFLLSHGHRHEIASFLGAEERHSLARALRQAL